MFPVDILQAAGILHRGRDQQLTLSPIFGQGESVYRLVRNDQGQPDVLSARGRKADPAGPRAKKS